MLDFALLNPLPLAIAMVGFVCLVTDGCSRRRRKPLPLPVRIRVEPSDAGKRVGASRHRP